MAFQQEFPSFCVSIYYLSLCLFVCCWCCCCSLLLLFGSSVTSVWKYLGMTLNPIISLSLQSLLHKISEQTNAYIPWLYLYPPKRTNNDAQVFWFNYIFSHKFKLPCQLKIIALKNFLIISNLSITAPHHLLFNLLSLFLLACLLGPMSYTTFRIT